MILASKCKLLKGFEVEWCSELPITGPEGQREADYDNATYTHRSFATLAEATTYANEVLPRDAWGAVQITEFVMEPISRKYPWVLHREYVGEPVTIERQ